MIRCEQCSQYTRDSRVEATYSVTITGRAKDVKLCGPCLTSESVSGNVVGYDVLGYREKGLSILFWICFVPIASAIWYLAWIIFNG